MSVSVVCLSVHDHIFRTTHPIFTYGHGSVLLWRHSDTLRTPSFMDDVISAHKPRLLDVAAQLKRSAHAALGLATSCVQFLIPVAGQQTHGTTFWTLKITTQVASPGGSLRSITALLKSVLSLVRWLSTWHCPQLQLRRLQIEINIWCHCTCCCMLAMEADTDRMAAAINSTERQTVHCILHGQCQ